MKTISLTQGQIALVDDADFEAVNAFKWHAHFVDRKIYARRNRVGAEKDGRTKIYLHQFLVPSASRTDHRDGNGLNNTRGNLRTASPSQNGHGFALKRANATSKYRGVSWSRWHKKWASQVTTVAGKRACLGFFDIEEEAARAFDAYVKENYRGFASPNFP